ncbi:hypothetical protein [Kitasatospora sp. NBC_01302]|uniref:hypothetical protein n=1 Tax=Kitasatospora sp. NBC_01302 TaxID=2903575 RepID=UPI002E11131C|nr:hypothetical protein OG294_06155 [Kitasatospora sp. NBC_01302]
MVSPPRRSPIDRPAQQPADRRTRAATARAAARRAEQRRRLLLRSAVGVLGLAMLGGLAAVVVSDRGNGTATATGTDPGPGTGTGTGIPPQPRTTAEGRTGAPPWEAPADPAAAVTAAGLPMLGSEGTVEHIHAHLDIYLDGRAVAVPALVGIDEGAQRISPLHTHDTSGVIHIESPVRADFTLGQFMTEWQVSLAADHLGGARTDAAHTLTAYVNGRPVTGDPAAIKLGAHDEIALVYGTSTENAQVSAPSGYAWPSGL